MGAQDKEPEGSRLPTQNAGTSLCNDVHQLDELQANVLFNTSAEVPGGLQQAFDPGKDCLFRRGGHLKTNWRGSWRLEEMCECWSRSNRYGD